MRNETVERIVNLLFQDVEMTDEVQALYDETMSNCQGALSGHDVPRAERR